MASRVTPLCGARLRDLLLGSLAHKRASGTSVEQAMYASMTPHDLFTRLLRKRPLAFWGSADTKLKTMRIVVNIELGVNTCIKQKKVLQARPIFS